jgi:hypothetical protein
MINLDTLFASLGIVSGNALAKNQRDFYNGIVWNDATITYNQYQFFEKLNTNRRTFFATYADNERDFYSNTTDPNITNFRTYYQYAAAYLPSDGPSWILTTGDWDDDGVWDDTAVWVD